MARRRYHAQPDQFSVDKTCVQLGPEEARHLRDVLRLHAGDEAFVFDGEGREFACVVEEHGRSGARLRVEAEVAPAHPESPLDLTLGVAPLKNEKFDLVVQKATELGIQRILPVVTKLADVRVRDAGEWTNRQTRLRRVALEAAKQSGRARVPEISAPVKFESLINEGSSSEPGRRLMFAERGGHALDSIIAGWSHRGARSPSSPSQPMIALVGPEGGWTDEEIAGAKQAEWHVITLGGRTLRAETAAIAIAALLQHLFGDLS